MRFQSIVKIGRDEGIAIIAVFVFFYVDDITLSVFSVADVNFDNFFTIFDFSLEIKNLRFTVLERRKVRLDNKSISTPFLPLKTDYKSLIRKRIPGKKTVIPKFSRFSRTLKTEDIDIAATRF